MKVFFQVIHEILRAPRRTAAKSLTVERATHVQAATRYSGIRRLFFLQGKVRGTSETHNLVQRGSTPRPATILLCVLCGLCVSCSVTRGVRAPDGTLTVSNYRLLWRSEAVDFSTNSTNFNARLILGKSTSDDASVNAVAEGVAAGVVKGAMSKP